MHPHGQYNGLYTNQHILITGGSGAFGSAMVERLLPEQPARLIVFSRDEAKQAQMRQRFPEAGPLRYFIGDVRNYDRLERAFDGVTLVIHAGAMKRVPECEAHPDEAWRTNVMGTENVIRAAVACHVPKTVFLSTDKAAGPNTTYGATKLVGERLMTTFGNIMGARHGSRFACTRYGNVQGSTGSVVPLFRKQLLNGEAFTVTDFQMTRFWMTMAEAVQLVHLAIGTMQGGEVFIPKIPAILVRDLCEAMAPRHPVRETGIRPNEKLHEGLLTAPEARYGYDQGDTLILEPPETPWTSCGRLARGCPVPEGYEYRSDTARRLNVDEIREYLKT